MNDGFASFVTQQAFGLGIGQHASIHHFSEQIDTAMLNNEEGEGLLGGSFRIVIGILLILDALYIIKDDLYALLGSGIHRQMATCELTRHLERLWCDDVGRLRQEGLYVCSFLKIEQEFLAGCLAELLVVVCVFLFHLFRNDGLRALCDLLEEGMVRM